MRQRLSLFYVLSVLSVLWVPCAWCETITTVTSQQVSTTAAPSKIPRAGLDGKLDPSWGTPGFAIYSTQGGKAAASKGSDTVEFKVTGGGSASATGKTVTINVTPPVATATTPGVVAVGTGLSIDPQTGKLNNTGIAGVASFKGRGGAVVPQTGDYSIGQISGAATVAGTGSYVDLLNKPVIPAAQVNSDWSAASGAAQILNKPAIPAAQVPADWNASSGAAQILNKPTVPSQLSQLSGDSTHRTVTDAEKTQWNNNSPTVSSVNGQQGAVTLNAVDVGADPLGSATSVQSGLNLHTGRIDNPHQVTKAQVGLPNADNTADANKPVSTAQQAALDLKLNAANPTFTGDMTTTNADGTHYSSDYNTTSCPPGVAEGTKCTLPSGIWWYKSGAWTQTGLLPSYTLPAASAGTLGGVKVGSGLAVDGSGTLSAPPYTLPTAGPSILGGVKVGTGLAVDGSGVLSATATGSGITVRAPFSGAQSVSVGNAYTTSAAATLTLSGHAAGTMSVLAQAVTRVVPDSPASSFAWRNPITDAVNTSSAGWSIDLPAGTYAVIDSDGTGAFQVKLTTKNLQTGVNEYTTPVPVASVSPSSINFGSVAAGSTSSASSTVLTNAGTANLTTGTPTISGTDAARFAISANGCNAATVTPGNSCTESVTFTPTAAGSYSAQLNLPHNAAGSPTVVALTGTGTSAGGYSDTFTYANGALPSVSSGIWATPSYAQPVNVSSNHIVASADAALNMAYRSDWSGADQCSKITVLATNGSYLNGPVVRMSASTQNYYMYRPSGEVQKILSGGTNLITDTGVVASNGDTLEICAIGTTITTYRNGTLTSTTPGESSIAAGYPGVRITYVGESLDTSVIGATHAP